jgi:hypothetical protein
MATPELAEEILDAEFELWLTDTYPDGVGTPVLCSQATTKADSRSATWRATFAAGYLLARRSAE